jgi:hypothetical protein
MKRVTLTVALALSAAACESGARDSAVEDFADKYTCREAWVQARIRTDVSPRVFRKRPEPPAEVKKDPQRLELWREKQDESDSYADSQKVVELKGCGHEVIETCSYTNHQTAHSQWVCSEQNYPPGVTKW